MQSNSSAILRSPITDEIIYPDSDGEPMAENTKQFEIITMLHGGIESMFHDRDDVFVAGDLFWYPVEGNPNIRLAPDIMVVFGRPRGHRSSYMQWKEENIAPQVVIEILSPSNRPTEMMNKLDFYDLHGVEEYFLYDPETHSFMTWRRTADGYLRLLHDEERLYSEKLRLVFTTEGKDLVVTRQDTGQRFETFRELFLRAEQEKQRATKEEQRAEQEKQRAEQEKQRAEQEKQRAEQEKQRAEQEKQRAERLLAQLLAAGIKPDESDVS